MHTLAGQVDLDDHRFFTSAPAATQSSSQPKRPLHRQACRVLVPEGIEFVEAQTDVIARASRARRCRPCRSLARYIKKVPQPRQQQSSPLSIFILVIHGREQFILLKRCVLGLPMLMNLYTSILCSSSQHCSTNLPGSSASVAQERKPQPKEPRNL